MKLYAVSYCLEHEGGSLLDFFSRKTDAIKRARKIHADHEQVFRIRKVIVPTKKADMIWFLNSVNSGHIRGEDVPWGGE
tara:strand:- start:568 stop:804 length:237 start_codon:yes stop_codon:yes gene_type:complete